MSFTLGVSLSKANLMYILYLCWRQLTTCLSLLRAGSRQLRAIHMAPVGAPAGARLPSAAPGPIPSEAPADIVFTVTAQAAVLTSSSLTLTNVPEVVQSFSYESKTGIYTTGAPLSHACALSYRQ